MGLGSNLYVNGNPFTQFTNRKDPEGFRQSSKYGYGRLGSEVKKPAPNSTPRSRLDRQVPRAALPNANPAAKRKRFLTKEDKGWSWLSVQMRDVASEVKMGMARKGELPAELVQALWGRKPGIKTWSRTTDAINDHFDKEAKETKAAPQRTAPKQKKAPETLMDVLLQKWVYFDHSHSDIQRGEKHVHAKYCESAFGHFLLPDGRQVHGTYSVPLSHLVQQLRKLLTTLRSKTVNAYYEDAPLFQPPEQETVPAFVPPVMKPLPQMYPIPGLLPPPTEESEGIGPELRLPAFEPPKPKEMPRFQMPDLLRPPPLKVPTQPIFLEDEHTIDRTPYKEDRLPVYYPPEMLPIPEWVEPKLQELPIQPVPVQVPVLAKPVEEPMPPFIPPEPELRPCEKSYYQPREGAAPHCEGKCMLHLDKYARRGKSCQAKSRPLVPLPQPPFPLPLELKPEPQFIPPELEELPKYEPPTLKVYPEYVPPSPPVLPAWKNPLPPEPIGWLGGQRPIFLVDCSGTMARGGMKMAQDVLTAILSPGGQVEAAASHFDVIMYSFDAWSFSAMDVQKGTKRFLKPEEALQEKTPASLEAAIRWVNRWGAGGSTNLLKALDVALSRTFADCIYLLTDGKPDKPVLVLQQINRIVKNQGSVVPIYTIGLATTTYGERVLQRISEATGACVRHVNSAWRREWPPLVGEELEDMLWARNAIHDIQRVNAGEGRKEDIQEMEQQVEMVYVRERHGPRILAYENEKRRREAEYRALLKSIDAENDVLIARVKKQHEDACEIVKERNRLVYEKAEGEWMQAVAKVRAENQRTIDAVEDWKLKVKEAEEENERRSQMAREDFERDLKMVEESNVVKLDEAREKYEKEYKRRKDVFEAALKETERKQREIEDTVNFRNKTNREFYEKMLTEITASNVAASEKARAEHTAKVKRVEAENARLKKEAEDGFNTQYNKVKAENERRVAALQKKIQEVKKAKAEAIEAYQREVAHAMAEHDALCKKFAALNKEAEEQAKSSWRVACEIVSAENLTAAKISVEEYDKQCKMVHEANTKRSVQLAAMMKKKYDMERQNEETTKARKTAWAKECERAEVEYEAEVARAKTEHENLCEEIERRNAEKFQTACLKHQAKVSAVEQYNDAMRPLVEASVLVNAEIVRVEKFIRYIANACLGANRDKPTDMINDLSRLGKSQQGMETKILIEALQEAYGTKRPDGLGYFERPSFYGNEQRGFSGMIPIHPPRVSQHHCADLDEHVQAQEAEAERLQNELNAKAAHDANGDHQHQPKQERPIFKF